MKMMYVFLILAVCLLIVLAGAQYLSTAESLDLRLSPDESGVILTTAHGEKLTLSNGKEIQATPFGENAVTFFLSMEDLEDCDHFFIEYEENGAFYRSDFVKDTVGQIKTFVRTQGDPVFSQIQFFFYK